jgi:predicted nucleic acid-binding protein
LSSFVIDASVVIKWVVDEASTAQALLLRRHRLLAPDLLIAECADVLRKKVRRKELLEEEALVNKTRSAGLPIKVSALLA